MEVKNLFGEESIILPIEWFAIFLFVFLMFFTLNYPFSLYITLFTLVVYFVVSSGIKRLSNLQLKARGMFFLIFSIFLFVGDTVTTWYAVHHLQGFFFEGNSVVVSLWNMFGYYLGEIITFLLFGSVVFIDYIFLNMDKREFVISGYVVSIFVFISFFVSLANNLFQLFNFFVYKIWGV